MPQGTASGLYRWPSSAVGARTPKGLIVAFIDRSDGSVTTTTLGVDRLDGTLLSLQAVDGLNGTASATTVISYGWSSSAVGSSSSGQVYLGYALASSVVGQTTAEIYAPSIFFSDYVQPPMGSRVFPPLPRSEGGLVESVKTAVVQALRATLSGTSLFDSGQSIYIDLEYPEVPAQYPGIWVQFSITKLNRAGISHEILYQDPDHNWSFIEEWTFTGRMTTTICALKSRDRDKIADTLIMQLAFSRTPELVLTRPDVDTKRYRSLVSALDANPYIAMTLQTDIIIPGGQQATQGTPWADNVMAYEDSYSVDLVGQFNVAFSHDGCYILSRIDQSPILMSDQQPYNPAQWLGRPDVGPLEGGLRPGGGVNSANTGM